MNKGEEAEMKFNGIKWNEVLMLQEERELITAAGGREEKNELLGYAPPAICAAEFHSTIVFINCFISSALPSLSFIHNHIPSIIQIQN